MEELVRANAALTTTNAELPASVGSLIEAKEQISCRVGNHQTNQNTRAREDTPPRPNNLCLHCKIEVMHAPDSCFDTKKTQLDVLGGGRVGCEDMGHLK